MSPAKFIPRILARAFLAGPWSIAGLIERGSFLFGRKPRWLIRMSKTFVKRTHPSPPGSTNVLIRSIAESIQFQRAMREPVRPLLRRYRLDEPQMGAIRWPVPDLATPAALAEWLGVSLGELDWFAGIRGGDRRAPDGALRHYRYQWLPKPTGGHRLLEIPKSKLKEIQRRILHDILDRVPPHEAAHGFVRGGSVRAFAEPHVGRWVVIRLDLRDFFIRVGAPRVHGIFKTLGYPAPVTRLFVGLCTHVTPYRELATIPMTSPADYLATRSEAMRLYRTCHLPQGAPTSPALANLAAFRLDLRLRSVAENSGVRYTRYADDLAFSGDASLAKHSAAWLDKVRLIAMDEGFTIHPKKTRVMHRSTRQRLAGVVVNERTNVARSDYDQLKSILHHCVVNGPSLENRDAHPDFRSHLSGRIEWISSLNPARGRRLRETFDRIDWQR